MMRWLPSGFILGLLLAAQPSAAVTVTLVSHAPHVIDPRDGESCTVRFRLSEPAEVALHVYDARELLIRTVASDGELDTGDHALVWDGRDLNGAAVPAEAYIYTIEAQSESGETVVWDAARQSGGKTVRPDRVRWNPDSGDIQYRLRKPARVRIRVGLGNGGPLLGTLLDWVARPPGLHRVKWDGLDRDGVYRIADRADLAIDVQAFTLPESTVFVGPPADEVRFVEGLPEDSPRRPDAVMNRNPMFNLAAQPVEARRDFAIDIALPEDVERDPDGVAVISGAVPVTVRVPGEARRRILDERSEAVFYVDGEYVFETETAFPPVTWEWDPKELSPGLHYLTVNLRGYSGHFGMKTIPVHVKAPASAP